MTSNVCCYDYEQHIDILQTSFSVCTVLWIQYTGLFWTPHRDVSEIDIKYYNHCFIDTTKESLHYKNHQLCFGTIAQCT